MITQKPIPVLKDLLAVQAHAISDTSCFLLRKQNLLFTIKIEERANGFAFIELADFGILKKFIYFLKVKEMPR